MLACRPFSRLRSSQPSDVVDSLTGPHAIALEVDIDFFSIRTVRAGNLHEPEHVSLTDQGVLAILEVVERETNLIAGLDIQRPPLALIVTPSRAGCHDHAAV